MSACRCFGICRCPRQPVRPERAALVELRGLIFPAGEPDETAGEWERRAWQIIARALEVKPCP